MGALIEIDDVVLASPRPSALAGAHLDRPARGQRVEARAVEVMGWAIGRERAAVAVELWCDGRLARRAPIGMARPDLEPVFPDVPAAGSAGFRTTLSAFGDEAAMDIEVRAVLADQRRVALGRIIGRRLWREGDDPDRPLVSVVIPCYGQAHFLPDAIESVLAQTYPHLDIVVVDDGSRDNASEVAGAYPGVRVVRQDNRGLAAARNTGLRSTRGEFLVFLDADDRLLPNAVETGLAELRARPDCGLVWGGWHLIGPDGARLPDAAPRAVGDPYLALLGECVISCPAAVMYRRALFEELRAFDPDVSASADYDVYLRATRDFPAHQHLEVVAEYRRHGGNMTLRPELILRSELEVLGRQRRYVNGDAARRRALAEGIRRARAKHGSAVVDRLADGVGAGRWAEAERLARVLVRHHPAGLAAAGARLVKDAARSLGVARPGG